MDVASDNDNEQAGGGMGGAGRGRGRGPRDESREDRTPSDWRNAPREMPSQDRPFRSERGDRGDRGCTTISILCPVMFSFLLVKFIVIGL